jgi:hypothetical protein
VPTVNLIDELFIVASPESIRAAVCDGDRWSRWLPGVQLSPYQDRGRLGVRWTLAGDLVGTAEVWLEEHGDGAVVHAYLRAEPGDARAGRRRLSRRAVLRRYALPLKHGLFEVKDLLEGDREPGSARVPLGERVVSASDSGPGDRRPGPHRPAEAGSEGAASDGRPDHLEHPDHR